MKRDVTRRGFLAAGGLAAAGPMIVPASVLGRGGAVAPSERIVLGGIGIGNRGRYVLKCMLAERDVQFVAVADVQKSRRDAVKAMVDKHYGSGDCVVTPEMFDIIGRDDIDAVLVATGDRWHSLASILCAKAGKDVYSEKPCGIDMGECEELAAAMLRYGRVFQAGTQRRSVGNFRFAVELARSGKLGRLKTLHASINKPVLRKDWLPAQPEPAKDVCDWERWLGPAPWRPYNKTYVNGGWRGFAGLDAGGRILDWGAHTVDLCQWANRSDETTPVTYEADGETIHAEYASGVKLVMRLGGFRGEGDWLGFGTCPVRFEGDEGWVETGDTGGVKVYPESLQTERRKFIERGTHPAQHTRNFFDCIKSRALTACHPEAMKNAHLSSHAASIAWQLGRKVTFDPKRGEFVGDDEANRMRTSSKRAPWKV